MTTKKPTTHEGRPTEQTPYGLLFTDTEAYARYAECSRIRDWLKAFLIDMEQLRLDAPTAVKRIEEFWATVQPCHGSLKTEQLARIRASLNGNGEIQLGAWLTSLRRDISSHWDYGVSSIAQDCERPPSGQERPYDGPLPRKSGDHTPAYGYQRAMATSRL